MADLVGAKLTTEALRGIIGDIESVSKDVDSIMSSFQSTMGKISGDAEGSIVEQITETGIQLFDGVMKLSNCFLNLGLKIGDYLKAMLTHDSDLAQSLRDRIEGN